MVDPEELDVGDLDLQEPTRHRNCCLEIWNTHRRWPRGSARGDLYVHGLRPGGSRARPRRVFLHTF